MHSSSKVCHFFISKRRSDYRLEKPKVFNYFIVDESTDISTHKHLCILVRYFSKKLQSVATRFLGLVPIPETTREIISCAIEKKNQEMWSNSNQLCGIFIRWCKYFGGM